MKLRSFSKHLADIEYAMRMFSWRIRLQYFLLSGEIQCIYAVVAFGIAPFVGSYIGGLIAECGSMRVLFLLTALLLTVLALCTGWLFKNKRNLA